MLPVTLIAALPAFISPEQHQELVKSTPDSFADIPPVARHIEPDVAVTLDPPVAGFTAPDAEKGTLYVLESALVFMSATGRGFQVEYPAITLHAISRADSGPSIYCQLDGGAEAQENGDGEKAEAEEEDEDEDELNELIIVPKDPASLEPIFEALSLCASLHPDPMDDMDDDDDAFVEESAFETFTGDEDQELSEVGRAALAHLESIIYDPFEKTREQEADEGQFADAEEGAKANPTVPDKKA